MSSSPRPGVSVHHVALCPADLEQSLRFYRDGLGLQTIFDAEIETDLMTLLDAPSNRARTVFLGLEGDPNQGSIELLAVDGFEPADEPKGGFAPRRGMHVLSFQVPVEETLTRLASLGLGGEPRRIRTSRSGDLVACVLDPDGTPVELLDQPVPLSRFATS